MSRHSDTPNVPGAEAKGLTDRNEVHELLGRGGMASVYRAVDVTSGRQVALKQLTVDIAMEPLDGGDLRERAPLPWQQACSLLFDVCCVARAHTDKQVQLLQALALLRTGDTTGIRLAS